LTSGRPTVQVKIPTILRTYTSGYKIVLAQGSTLGEVIGDLDVHYPGLVVRLLTEDGALHRFVNIYVDDEDVRFTGSLARVISGGENVTILPAAAGGNR
jgi:sulfur-carrier protein